MTIETWTDHLLGFVIGVLATAWAYRFYFKFRTRLHASLRWPWKKPERSPVPTVPRRVEQWEPLTPEQARTHVQEKIAQTMHKFVRENPCTPDMLDQLALYFSQMGRDSDAEAMWMEAGFKFMEKREFSQAAGIFQNLLRRNPGHEAYRRRLHSALRGDDDEENAVGALL